MPPLLAERVELLKEMAREDLRHSTKAKTEQMRMRWRCRAATTRIDAAGMLWTWRRTGEFSPHFT